jgi:general L-amino acid transport system substrate-binding protein
MFLMPPCARAGALVVAAATLLAVAWAPPSATAGETLTDIKARGFVRCGVSEGIAGFSAKGPSGRWAGLDADFCRAVAAAALGDVEKVTFVPLRASARFPALQLKAIDLLARNTTWTLDRSGSTARAHGGARTASTPARPRGGGVNRSYAPRN